jgi:hypothetical protein
VSSEAEDVEGGGVKEQGGDDYLSPVFKARLVMCVGCAGGTCCGAWSMGAFGPLLDVPPANLQSMYLPPHPA